MCRSGSTTIDDHANTRGQAQQMRQETLQNAARRCSAANTTAVCRGCFVGNPGTTPGMNDPGHRPWVLSGVVGSSGPEGEARRRSPKAKPEGEARRRSPKAKPEGEAPKRSPTKKPANFIIATKTPHTHKHRKQRTAHREPRRHARDNSEQPRPSHRRLQSHARAKASQTKRPGHEKRGATRRRSRANRHTHTAPMAEDETRTKAGRP